MINKLKWYQKKKQKKKTKLKKAKEKMPFYSYTVVKAGGGVLRDASVEYYL